MEELKMVKLTGSQNYQAWKFQTGIMLKIMKNGDLLQMERFGSKEYCHTPKQKRRKWDQKSKKGIFVGHDENVEGYHIYFKNTDKVEFSYIKM